MLTESDDAPTIAHAHILFTGSNFLMATGSHTFRCHIIRELSNVKNLRVRYCYLSNESQVGMALKTNTEVRNEYRYQYGRKEPELRGLGVVV